MTATSEALRADERQRSLGARIVVGAPDRLLIALLAATVAVSVAVTARLFSPWLVVPLFVVLLVALWRFVPVLPRRGRLEVWGTLGMLLFVAGWIVVNAHYATTMLSATRDPSLYTMVGIWLTSHTAPGIDVSGAQSLIHGIDGFTTSLGPFRPDADGVIRLQGGATLPALLATSGWFAGVPGVLAGNTVLGGMGLVSVFALGRRLVPWGFALAGTVALGLSMTMIFLSRATYSETIMLAVCAAGLAWLIAAVREGRIGLWVVSGVFLGCAGFARVDGPVALIGPAAVLGIAVFLVRDEQRLRSLLRGTPWFILSGLVTLGLGVAGLAVNETDYLRALAAQTGMLWAAMLALLIGVLVCVVIRRRLERAVLPRRAAAVVALTGGIAFSALFLYWLSRPLWLVERHSAGIYATAVAGYQAQDGVPIDPHRSYDEMTLAWVGWYFGWPMVALAGVGLVLMVYLGIRRRSVPLLLVAGATVSVALLYFTRVSITPDQYWAYRRLLPIITPGFLIAALYPLALLWRAVRLRAVLRSVAVVGALLVALVPLVTWNPLLRVVDGRGMEPFVDSMCDAIHGDAVLYTTRGQNPYYQVALRTICGVEVITDTGETTPSELAQLAARRPGLEVLVFADGALPGATGLGAPTGTFHIDRWNGGVVRLPDTLSGKDLQYWAGTLDASGRFVPR